MDRVSCFATLSCLILITGCGQEKPPEATATAEPVLKSTGSTSSSATSKNEGKVDLTETTSKSSLVATAATGTAEATFQQTLIAFQEGRLDAAYDFLPASFQADVENLVHDFGSRMDAELWSKTFGLVGKFANILKTKKNLILSLDNVKRAPMAEQIKPHWDAIATGLQDLSTGEISTVEGLKRCNIRKLLGSASGLLKGLPLPKFGDVSVATVESTDDVATLLYRESKNGEARQVEFVKVEGKWLPKSIATGWAAGIADAKSRLSDLSEQLAAIKPDTMRQFDTFSGMLDQLQQAKNADEFNAAAGPLVFAVLFSAKMAEQAIQESALAPRKGNAVHLTINRELKDQELTKLKDAVGAAMNDQSIEFEMIANDGKTRCRFTSIPDPQVLIPVLRKHFNSTNVELNSETRTIQVELK